VSHFDLLHPALQHHIVNSLGWRDLRPFQEAVIPRIVAGEHLIILAPTAGGKTEAAFLPILSRMLSEDWQGLSLLYLCPIKALLNNLESRLHRYCGLVGRNAALWHGDVSTADRKRIQRDAPDCLLTTPESLEVMLVSPNVDSSNLLQNVRAVIVDEIHAFAGDDRGWHLLSVLERVTRLAGREIQRVGLSATVGNPELLVDWLAGSCSGPRGIALPPAPQDRPADVKLDYVGSFQNAAVVISRVGRGEKCLVFVDSRSGAEKLGAELRALGVTTFVTHSSLSIDQRRQAEAAFASRSDCVIVATSVLELGIDVGDLDRVIQIDSPSNVSSFLQRMGRTGRRPGSPRNCLFLATRDESLIQAMGLVALWERGFVEPVIPPPSPLHILAQQLMALTLQERGIGRRTWYEWVKRMPGFALIPAATRERIVEWMLTQEILWEDEGILWFGKRGEEEFGRKHFLELVSVFVSPPLFSVLHGRQELGFVDEMTFFGKQSDPRVLLLGGRAWRVNHLDWQRRVAYVEPADSVGRSRWQGQGQVLHYDLCQSIKFVLASEEMSERWSHRVRDRIGVLREEQAWLESANTAVVSDNDGRLCWWTFAGQRANHVLAQRLSSLTSSNVKAGNLALEFESRISLDGIEAAMAIVRRGEADGVRPVVDEGVVDGLKFSACLPTDMAMEMLGDRLADVFGAKKVLDQRVRFINSADHEDGSYSTTEDEARITHLHTRN
jgi:ATP-dependent Lhr-like helicase